MDSLLVSSLSANSNYSTVTQLYFFGFDEIKQYPQLIGILFCIMYILSVSGNIFVCYVIKKEESLHSPMYIIISNLALSDIVYSTVIIPKIIEMYLLNNFIIGLKACMAQMSCLHFIGTVDSLLLLLMALDRYVSICNPLRYSSIITQNVASLMCSACWILPIAVPVVLLFYSVTLPYCGPNKIQHLYCEFGLLIRLACTNTSFNMYVGVTFGCTVLLSCFVLISLSYLQIIVTIFKITESGGRMKAFYTCSTQLIVISIFMIPRVFAYITLLIGFYLPLEVRILLGAVYSILPPLVHPIIYSLRTKEIKDFIVKRLKSKRQISLAVCICLK
ncbi:olfactory receptor 6N1-like [Erpetoichthys calabaricus]|uniref:olfactory receptor 6N1-like n=1 Tax=Erpetoichthys calabaricus TaxID=27687 RepID=UPI0022344F8F|nr:olfactory receptor 6N1-like [Erpetoichthys calabaricus]